MSDGVAEYRKVEAWLNSLYVGEIAAIERERTADDSIDKEFVIETILEHCRTEDDLLFKLYKQATALSHTNIELPEKFLCVELMICYTDNTWNTDYLYIPYSKVNEIGGRDSNQELLTECINRWTEQEDAARDQRGSIGPGIAHYGLYNVNWDEPVDKDGEHIEE